MPSSRDSFRRNRVAPVGTSILPRFPAAAYSRQKPPCILQTLSIREVAVHERYRHGAFAHGRSAALHRPVPHIASRE
jgi:hypothetical protein